MPTFVKGNMWDIFGKTDLFVITTNPVRRKDGAVVMGRGIAKEAATRFPTMPFDFGKRLTAYEHEQNYVDVLAPTNVGYIGLYDNQLVGWFMVKKHWRDPALPSVIESSVMSLNRIASYRNAGNQLLQRIDLNFPGIGNGNLAREDVLPLLEVLPDNVHIWEFE